MLFSIEMLDLSFSKFLTDSNIDPLYQMIKYNQSYKILLVPHCSFLETSKEILQWSKYSKKDFAAIARL